MDNKTTGIVAILVLIALVVGYVLWENNSDGQTTMEEGANPNAPALTEPAGNAGTGTGGGMAPSGTAPAAPPP